MFGIAHDFIIIDGRIVEAKEFHELFKLFGFWVWAWLIFVRDKIDQILG